MMSDFRVEHANRSSRIGVTIAAAALVLFAAAPWWADRADLRLLSEIFAYVALASLWNLLAGYAGLVSVGQQVTAGGPFNATKRAKLFLEKLGISDLAAFAGVHAFPARIKCATLGGAKMMGRAHELGSVEKIDALIESIIHLFKSIRFGVLLAISHRAEADG